MPKSNGRIRATSTFVAFFPTSLFSKWYHTLFGAVFPLKLGYIINVTSVALIQIYYMKYSKCSIILFCASKMDKTVS